MQCPKCKCKSGLFKTLFKRKTGSKNSFCVRCNAEVKFKISYSKVFILAVSIGVVTGVIGGILNISGAVSSGAAAGAIVAIIVGAQPFTKVELISNETSPNTV